MHLLFITEYYPKTLLGDVHGGVEFRVFQLSQLLAQNNEVTVIASQETDKPVHQKIGRVKVLRVGKKRAYTRSGSIWERLSFMIMASVIALREDFDVVEGSSFFAWLPAWIGGVIRNRKKVMLIADTVENYGKNIPYVTHKGLTVFERLLFNLPWNGVVVISKTVQKKLMNHKIISKTNVIPCGVFLPKKSTRTYKTFTICCISRLVPYKDVETLIRAVHLLLKMGHHLQLIIIGDGEQEKQLKSLTGSLHIADTIVFRGFIPGHKQVMKVLRSCHLFCLPSKVEGFGIATIEAFSSAIPAVLADLPIHHEVTQEKGALFFEPGNFQDLAEKISVLIDNPRYRNKLSVEGYKIARAYQWPQIANDTLTYYENLLTY
ncbi:glycosyltransferase family 1 protein [Candidatus Microgenomates bacterium]|nr:MAG: glycosyltransferase family 1 protein [Candidatus Microgenomates bacterium]